MTITSNESIPFPLQTLGRAVKQKPTYLLGLCGVQSLANTRSHETCDPESWDSSVWEIGLEALTGSMAEQWGKTPVLIRHRDLLADHLSPAQSRNRYTHAESIARWRSMPLCVLDLGCDSAESVRKYGRQCDGMAMIVLGSLKHAKTYLRQFRRDAIPWIGYWTVALRADLEDNSIRETVRKAA